MKKLLITAIAVVLLAGCKTAQEELAAINSRMPEGCTMIDLGSYGDIDNLMVATCDGRATETTMGQRSRMVGKVYVEDTYAVGVVK